MLHVSLDAKFKDNLQFNLKRDKVEKMFMKRDQYKSKKPYKK